MVHRFSYVDVKKAKLECRIKEVSKHEIPVTYDIKMEYIRLIKEDAEKRYKNAYLSQVQYYLNRVIVKVVGLQKEIDMKKFLVGPEDHGGSGRKTLKQLIMEDATYIKESGVEYSNQVRKVQKANEGGGWLITGKKQDAGNLTHFGYQILPKMLQEWCKRHNLTTTRIGMNPGMSKVS